MSYIRLVYPGVAIAAIFVVACGMLYPMAISLIAGVAFPWQAAGSPLVRDGRVVGSVLIGQNFTGPEYFHSRPSAVGYDALRSGASNLGPDNPLLIGEVKSRLKPGETLVPEDAVLGSASGIDPDISVENAMMQAPRVAAYRGVDEHTIVSLIKAHEQGRLLGIWGEPRVNVLELNLALESMGKS